MSKKRPTDYHAERCKEMAPILIPALRCIAERYGYSLSVHGSLEYDIDLVACPWRVAACSEETVAMAIGKAVAAISGDGAPPTRDQPDKKPYGRLAWAFHIGGGPYVDLSVMPRFPPTPKKVRSHKEKP